MKFSEMPYVRPDLEALRQAADFLQGLQAALSRIPMCAMLW